jgi:hypothetical protein
MLLQRYSASGLSCERAFDRRQGEPVVKLLGHSAQPLELSPDFLALLAAPQRCQRPLTGSEEVGPGQWLGPGRARRCARLSGPAALEIGDRAEQLLAVTARDPSFSRSASLSSGSTPASMSLARNASS